MECDIYDFDIICCAAVTIIVITTIVVICLVVICLVVIGIICIIINSVYKCTITRSASLDQPPPCQSLE